MSVEFSEYQKGLLPNSARYKSEGNGTTEDNSQKGRIELSVENDQKVFIITREQHEEKYPLTSIKKIKHEGQTLTIIFEDGIYIILKMTGGLDVEFSSAIRELSM
uniref:Uncharacterized protein n=1 Tax=Panagrolaimus sp. JU765 TaxID=591449 RepID=A0AC34Q559_9BILA